MAAAMMLVIIRIARRRNFPMEVPVRGRRSRDISCDAAPSAHAGRAARRIYSGVFTPTGGGGRALYALVLALFVYRALD